MNPLAKSYLVRIFQTAVTAVMPEALVRNALRITEDGLSLRCGTVAAAIRREEVRNVYLVGGGKAARGMGDAAASVLGDMVAGGVVAVPEEAGGEAGPIRYIEAGHPIPDEGSREAARCVMELLSNAEQGDLVVALLSGGGSAMLSEPPGAISIGEKERVLRLLLRSGADIGEVNTVRRHLSLVKGGRMAETAYPARVWALLLSDVAGDDPSVIASGPFSPDPTTYRDALRVLARFRILPQVPDSVILHLESGAAGKIPETLKPGDPACRGVTTAVLASNRTALEAAADAARATVRCPSARCRGSSEGKPANAGAFVAEMRKWRADFSRANGSVARGGRNDGDGYREGEGGEVPGICLVRRDRPGRRGGYGGPVRCHGRDRRGHGRHGRFCLRRYMRPRQGERALSEGTSRR